MGTPTNCPEMRNRSVFVFVRSFEATVVYPCDIEIVEQF
jgi:hypothetical protein